VLDLHLQALVKIQRSPQYSAAHSNLRVAALG
jgi:hypothetical protein